VPIIKVINTRIEMTELAQKLEQLRNVVIRYVARLVLIIIAPLPVENVALMTRQGNLKLIAGSWLLALGSMGTTLQNGLLSIVDGKKLGHFLYAQRLAEQEHVIHRGSV
jgi:hypothetical protein